MTDALTTEAEKALAEAFAPGRHDEPTWLSARRKLGYDLFAQSGLPHRRVEAFKFTDLKRRLNAPLRQAQPLEGDVTVPPDLDALCCARIVIANGYVRPDLSRLDGLPNGVRVSPTALALSETPDAVESALGARAPAYDLPTLALNDALWTDGAFLHAAKGAVSDRPIHVVVAVDGDDGAAAHIRNLIRVEDGASISIVESHVGGPSATLSHSATEIQVGAGASLARLVLQAHGPNAAFLAETIAEVAGEGRFHDGAFTQGAGLSRSETHAFLSAPGARANLDGAYVLEGRQHADHTLVIDHGAPDCESRQLYKGAIDGGAHAVFQGKFHVHQAAQRTDAYQLNQALLLSEKAEIFSKPELEIYADDVKCSHGASAGDLDDDALFYLRSRGVTRDEARALLVEAFLIEAVEAMPDFAQDAVRARAQAWLQRSNGSSA